MIERLIRRAVAKRAGAGGPAHVVFSCGAGGVGRISPAGRRGRVACARREMDLVPYFAYGTTQQGFANHRRYSELLGERVARVRTASGHAVVVPYRAACSNPGCPYRTGWRRWWPASSRCASRATCS